MTRWQRAGLVLIILTGALLRFGGLSHDLHEGKTYHPDTPKQIRAVERYLKGHYYQHIGHPDYDGYPLFNAHLVEYVCRAIQPIRRGTLTLIGIPCDDRAQDLLTLYWITLLLNATLATVAIGVVWRIGRENFGPGAALAAAALQALSPVDVTACHYATGDTTAAFFGALSLLFAFRIYRLGRYRDYALAAASAVLGFSAKYHAGMAVFPILTAHLLRCGSPRMWLTAPSIRRMGVVAVAGTIALFLSIPALFEHFGPQLRDILMAFSHSASRLPPELRNSGALDKLVYSMQHNLPVLLRILSPFVCLAAVLSVCASFRRLPAVPILLSLPVAYFVMGVGTKPLVHPVYHTVMTPAMFLLTAAFFARDLASLALWRRRLWRGAAAAALVLSALILGREACRECFFQWHMDTRRMAEAWTAENVPPSFAAVRGRYTCPFPSAVESGAAPQGTLITRGGLGPVEIPPGFMHLKQFALEHDPLMQFRNIPIEAYLGATALVRAGFTLPLFQRWPSETGNQFIFDNGVEFCRSGKTLAVAPSTETVRRLVCEKPVERAWLAIRNGPTHNALRIEFAGFTRHLLLRAYESIWLQVTAPQPEFPSGQGLYFYRWRVSASDGLARVTLATSLLEAGTALYNLGRFAEARPLLEQAAQATGNPTLAAEALVAALAAGQPDGVSDTTRKLAAQLTHFGAGDTPARFKAYGITQAYLDQLPFAVLGTDAVKSHEPRRRALFRPVVSAEVEQNEGEQGPPVRPMVPSEPSYVATGALLLDPGYYVGTVRLTFARATAPTNRVGFQVLDALGTVRSEDVLHLPAGQRGQSVDAPLAFVIPWDLPVAALRFQADGALNFTVDRIAFAPDYTAGSASLAHAVRLYGELNPAATPPDLLLYEPLLGLGDRLVSEGRTTEAFECFRAAMRLRPDAAAPLERTLGLEAKLADDQRATAAALAARFQAARARRATCETDVLFARGVRLTRAALRDGAVARGGAIGLNAYWQIERPGADLDQLAVAAHIVDAAGKIVFQGDHPLSYDLRLPSAPDAIEPFFNEYRVPLAIKPGEYSVRLGLYLPSEKRPIKILQSSLGHRKDSVVLPLKVQVTK
jgi:hypothetical protein